MPIVEINYCLNCGSTPKIWVRYHSNFGGYNSVVHYLQCKKECLEPRACSSSSNAERKLTSAWNEKNPEIKLPVVIDKYEGKINWSRELAKIKDNFFKSDSTVCRMTYCEFSIFLQANYVLNAPYDFFCSAISPISCESQGDYFTRHFPKMQTKGVSGEEIYLTRVRRKFYF